MLSDHDCQLLTTLVEEGQLGPDDRKAAHRLLSRSAEARELLQQLQEDARALRVLPRRTLPADFPQRVLQAVADRGLRPGIAPPAPRPRPVPAWAGLAAAAAVLLAVT